MTTNKCLSKEAVNDIMKKSKERRSMTFALICYARLGEDVGCVTPFEAYKRIEGAYRSNEPLALDIWAVKECLLILKLNGEDETIRAIREIYFKPFSNDLTRKVNRNEISELILRFAYENYLDERTVYRRLRKARQLWLDIRNTVKWE